MVASVSATQHVESFLWRRGYGRFGQHSSLLVFIPLIAEECGAVPAAGRRPRTSLPKISAGDRPGTPICLAFLWSFPFPWRPLRNPGIRDQQTNRSNRSAMASQSGSSRCGRVRHGEPDAGAADRYHALRHLDRMRRLRHLLANPKPRVAAAPRLPRSTRPARPRCVVAGPRSGRSSRRPSAVSVCRTAALSSL